MPRELIESINRILDEEEMPIQQPNPFDTIPSFNQPITRTQTGTLLHEHENRAINLIHKQLIEGASIRVINTELRQGEGGRDNLRVRITLELDTTTQELRVTRL